MVGVGRAGQAAARALAARAGPHAVRAWDRSQSDRAHRIRDELARDGVEVALGGDGVELLDAAPAPRCLVKSPGIPFEVPLIQAAQRRGSALVDELEIAWRLDGRPVVGITGTNGKSTVAALVEAILARAGHRPAVTGNTEFGPAFSALAAEAADVAVAEVSSFQLEGCPAFLPEVAVVTNLTKDHLDRHRTMAAYAEAKRRIALRDDACAPVAVVGVRARFGRELARQVAAAGGRVTTVGDAGDADVGLREWLPAGDGARVRAVVRGERLDIRTRLTGEHNARNVLTALAVADALDLGREATLDALATTPAPPGRLERIGDGPVEVLVDYAHNPDGIRQALSAARARRAAPESRVVAVACALSVLSIEQRRAMGREAARGCDHLVLSADRIRPDDPVDALPPGLEEGARAARAASVEVVPDRRDAIRRAMAAAIPGDVVPVLGRGARTHALDAADRPCELDDRALAREAIAAAGRL